MIVSGFRQANQDDASATAISTAVGDLKWDHSPPLRWRSQTPTLPNPEKKHLKANNRQGVSVIEMTQTLGLQPEISSSD